jgi:hypothetical protein
MSLLTQFYPGPGGGGGAPSALNSAVYFTGYTDRDGVFHYVDPPEPTRTSSTATNINPGTLPSVSNVIQPTGYYSGGAIVLWPFTTAQRVFSQYLQTIEISDLTVPALASGDQITMEAGSQLTTLKLGHLRMVNSSTLLFNNCPNLTTVEIGSILCNTTTGLDLSGAALTQASVDNVLTAAAGDTFSGAGTIDLSLGTSSAPSAYVSTTIIPYLTSAGLTIVTN